jgi:hypothetical protein
MFASQVSVKTDKIKVEVKSGKYITRSWKGDYVPNVTDTSLTDGKVYLHLRFENNVPVVREVNVSEILIVNQKL